MDACQNVNNGTDNWGTSQSGEWETQAYSGQEQFQEGSPLCSGVRDQHPGDLRKGDAECK